MSPEEMEKRIEALEGKAKELAGKLKLAAFLIPLLAIFGIYMEINIRDALKNADDVQQAVDKAESELAAVRTEHIAALGEVQVEIEGALSEQGAHLAEELENKTEESLQQIANALTQSLLEIATALSSALERLQQELLRALEAVTSQEFLLSTQFNGEIHYFYTKNAAAAGGVLTSVKGNAAPLQVELR